MRQWKAAVAWSDEGENGGKADGGDAGPCDGCGAVGHGGNHVVDQEQGPGLLPGPGAAPSTTRPRRL